MTDQTIEIVLHTCRRRHAPAEAATARKRAPVRFIVLPVPGSHDGEADGADRLPERRTRDDLAQATWEDAEWR